MPSQSTSSSAKFWAEEIDHVRGAAEVESDAYDMKSRVVIPLATAL